MLGMHDRLTQDGNRYNFEGCLMHPQFSNFRNYDSYDAAVLKTLDTIIFSYKIKPICLPQQRKCRCASAKKIPLLQI